MGNRHPAVDVLDTVTVDKEASLRVRAALEREGRSSDGVVVKQRAPEELDMDEGLTDEYLAKYNKRHEAQYIQLRLRDIVHDLGNTLANAFTRGDELEDAAKKTDELVASSKEVFLRTASCSTRFLENCKAFPSRCVAWGGGFCKGDDDAA